MLLSSTLDMNNEGYYYNYYHAYNSNNSINIYFRIIFMVGDIDPNEKISYTYDSEWPDQLASYGITINGSTVNHVITYDDQGNPTQITNLQYNGITYNHADLSWDGRELANIKVYSTSGSTTKVAEIWYTYNDQGYRVSKTLDSDGNGVFDKKYVYLLSGDLVLSETVSVYVNSVWVEDYQINYLYEHDGTAVGFELLDSGVIHHYLYVKNLQGDITQIIQDNGSIVVEYFYDAFGQILDITGSLSATIGEYNSLRYRSYKYDNEFGLYYLNSRYYNPEIGRFISSDGQLGELGNILSTNMYAYCANNPVMYSDNSGYSPKTWQWILGGIGAAFVLTAVGLTIFATGGLGAFGVGALWGSTILGFAGAAVGGAIAYASGGDVLGGILAGLGIGASVGFFVGGAIGYSKYSICKPGSIGNPNGTGQVHHVFGKKQETILYQKFGLNRNDYLVRANNLDAHFGYQAWHRVYNNKVFSLLKGSKTILDLQRGVNAIYSTQLMIGKFGLTIISLIP